MNYPISTVLVASAVFLAMLTTLAFKPKIVRRVTGTATALSGIFGLVIYGLGFGANAATPEEMLIAAFKTISYTVSMYGGKEDFSALMNAASWFRESPALQTVYWAVHLIAMYATASALISSLGKKLVREIRQAVLPFKKVCLIYGDTAKTLKYAEKISRDESIQLVFTDSEGKTPVENDLRENTVILPSSDITADGKWLKKMRIGKGKRSINIISLCDKDTATLKFVKDVLEAFKAQNIGAKHLKMSALCESPFNFAFVSQQKDGHGHYYQADFFTLADLAAGKLMTMAPPYRTMSFDKATCSADGDFRALIIGFGETGQTVLRYLVRNSQFLGSSFSALVIDKENGTAGGMFKTLYRQMIDTYHITFEDMDANSSEFSEMLEEEAHNLKYIVVCTGSDETNGELIRQIRSFKRVHPEKIGDNAVMAALTKEKVTVYTDSIHTTGETSKPAVDMEEIISGSNDLAARAYSDSAYRSMAEKDGKADSAGIDVETEERDYWYRKDPVDRESTRASAGFLPALFASAGLAPDSYKGKEGRDRLLDELNSDRARLERLASLEHLRWNAFEYSMGVTPLGEQEYLEGIKEADGLADEAIALYEQAASGAETAAEANRAFDRAKERFATVRKNIPSYGVGGKHVCITSFDELARLWEEYRPLAEKYNRLIGMYNEANSGKKPPQAETSLTDFIQQDVKNVYHMADLIGKA
ncbi:MAG: hypothetical protein IK026_04760 [Eubacteriaceae bacterium]|nr:hypothetical protein [Eubacteriaceae bacterium]